MNAVVGAEEIEKQMANANNNWTIPTRIGGMVTHFSFHHMNFIGPPGNLGILLSKPTL